MDIQFVFFALNARLIFQGGRLASRGEGYQALPLNLGLGLGGREHCKHRSSVSIWVGGPVTWILAEWSVRLSVRPSVCP